jgi:hypothetical protein
MKKAIHQGECQVCGRMQKLPSDLLSKHGYTTRCGFFEGTCFGSGELPFEKDKKLVDIAIARAEERLRDLKQNAAKRLKSTNPNDVVYDAYEDWSRFGFGRRDYGYKCLTGRIEKRGSYDFWFISPLITGKTYEHVLRLAGMTSSLEENVKYLNELESKRILRIADQVQDYLNWQYGRVKGWKVRPLLKIDEKRIGRKVS